MNKTIKVGRRKTAVARVTVEPAKTAGKGVITVNGRSFEDFFPIDIQRLKVSEPFRVTGLTMADYDITVNVAGGGTTGQAEAVRLGISRNLINQNEEHRSSLKKPGLLTRDSRMVERKKPGLRKARKKTQFSKR